MHSIDTLKIPIFRKYSFLTGESLNNLSQNFIKYINAKHIDTSEGIISGLDARYIEKDNCFEISKGVFKFKDRVYFLKDNVYINRPIKEGRYALILNVKSSISEEYEIIENQFYFKEESKIKDDDYIIFNLLLRDGADIYREINSFSEFSMEYNLIDLTNQKYAVLNSKSHTINPKILKKWSKEMLNFDLDTYDINLIFQILNSITSKDLIVCYINLKLGLKLEELSNRDLVNYLSQILNNKEKKESIENETESESIKSFFVS